MRFQYSDLDFWHTGMHERKEQGLLTGFLKNSHLGKWAILGSKMVHPYNCGSTVRIFF